MATSQPIKSANDAALSKQPIYKRWMSKDPLVNWLVLAAVALVVIGGGLYWHYHNKSAPGAPKYAYAKSYKSTELYTLPGTEKGRGLTFNKPTDFSIFGAAKDTSVQFIQLAKNPKNSSYIAVARGAVSSNNFSSPSQPSTTYLNSLKDTLKMDPASQDYKDATKSFETFAKSDFPEPTIIVTMGTASPFTSPFIKDNAYQFDLTATDSSGATPVQTGKVIAVVGKNTFYYFMIAADAYNWQADFADFQAILDSIEIDT